MKVYTYILLFITIVLLHCLWHVLYIRKYNGMKAKYKAISILLTWLVICLIGFLGFSFSAWLLMPFSCILMWVIKDAVLGWFLHKDIFYLGTGKFDRYIDKLMQSGKGAFIFKLVCLLFFSGMLKYLQ